MGSKNGVIRVNGKRIKRKSAIFDFSKHHFKVLKFKSRIGNYEVRGLRKERFSFKYNRHTRSYTIVVGSLTKQHSGFYAHPKQAQKYQLTREKSKFNKYIDFRHLRIIKPTEITIRRAKKCCKVVRKISTRRQCFRDYVRTRKCFHVYRRKHKPSLKGHGKHKFNMNPAVRNCVRDRCAGMRKDLERKIIKDMEKEKKVVIKIDNKKKKISKSS